MIYRRLADQKCIFWKNTICRCAEIQHGVTWKPAGRIFGIDGNKLKFKYCRVFMKDYIVNANLEFRLGIVLYMDCMFMTKKNMILNVLRALDLAR